jgi:hypothetical protein
MAERCAPFLVTMGASEAAGKRLWRIHIMSSWRGYGELGEGRG